MEINKKAQAQKAIDTSWQLMLVFGVVVFAGMIPDVAMATTMGTILCSAVAYIQSDIARGIATLAIIIVGLGALLGKVSWGMAVLVAVGIGTIFGAQALASAIGVTGTC